MSFDLFFQPVRFDGSTERRVNPFTKEEQETPRSARLDREETAAVRQLLAAACGGGKPDEFGCYAVQVADGGSTEVFAKRLEEGCMVALRGITPGIVALLFEILRAGHWALLGDEGALVASMDDVRGVPEDFPPVRVCASAAELGEAIAPGLVEWTRYRDRVLGPA